MLGFEADLDAPAALEAFRHDLMLARYRAIGRFPSMILRIPGKGSQIIVGYRPYEVLMEAICPETREPTEALA